MIFTGLDEKLMWRVGTDFEGLTEAYESSFWPFLIRFTKVNFVGIRLRASAMRRRPEQEER